MTEQTERCVVITGASSGIGRACALCLVKRAFRVFAGVRKMKDGEALREEAGDAVVPVEIDVTDGATIAAALERVGGALGERGLDGLVNNAGIGTPAPLTARRPRVRYPVGADATLLVTLPRVLPDRVLDHVRLRLFGMPTGFGCEPATSKQLVEGEPRHA